MGRSKQWVVSRWRSIQIGRDGWNGFGESLTDAAGGGTLKVQPASYQLLEYQTDMRRCRFDTLGKQTSAHLAGGPTPYTGWVPPARWVSAGAASPSPPTARAGWQPARAVGEVHPPCGQDISPPARWVGLFPAHNSEGLLLIDFSQESGRLFVLQ